MVTKPSDRSQSRAAFMPGSARQRAGPNGSAAWRVRILDEIVALDLIRTRQLRGIDKYDEVWDGVYVMPPMPTNPHQGLVQRVGTILDETIFQEGRGDVYPGANVSDRRYDWQTNYRVPDVAVVLKNSRAVDCGTHWFGGPDFLVEIQSPRDDTEGKIPFYSTIHVRELLVIQRDSRRLTLYRHDGANLVAVAPSQFQGQKWLVSEVEPLVFRRRVIRGRARIEIQRTDGKPGKWVV